MPLPACLLPKQHVCPVYIDAMFIEQPANKTPMLYTSIHNQFVELYVAAPRSLYEKTLLYLRYHYEEATWNKKYPKLLKMLQKRGMISSYETSARLSVVGFLEESETYLMEHLKQYGVFFILEQNRKETDVKWEGILL